MKQDKDLVFSGTYLLLSARHQQHVLLFYFPGSMVLGGHICLCLATWPSVNYSRVHRIWKLLGVPDCVGQRTTIVLQPNHHPESQHRYKVEVQKESIVE